MRHKHADVIHAWAEGEAIEWYDPLNEKWYPVPAPGSDLLCWEERHEYRIKPKIVKKEGWVNVYKNNIARDVFYRVYATKNEADKRDGIDRVACIHIDWEEEE